MSPEKTHLPRLHQVMTRLKPAATRIRPFAMKTGKVARDNVHRGRALAAPWVKRSGHGLRETVAPKVSSLLHSAARLIEPGSPDAGPSNSETAAPTPAEGGDGQAKSP